MSDFNYSNNPNTWTQTEGVSVSQQKPDGGVVGATVNTVALVGTTTRGDSLAQVNTPAQFLALFGGRDYGGGGAIVNQVWKAMLNRQFSWPLIVSPVTAAAATGASSSPVGTTAAVASTGSLTSAAKADYTTGQTFTIGDGAHAATVFEIRKAGGAASGSNVAVDLTSATTANDCAILIANTINGVTTGLTVTAGTPSSGTFTLTADTQDSTHNVPITTTITATGFAVSGMSGGVDYSASTAIVDIAATSTGQWANGATGYGVTYDIATASDGNADHWNLTLHFQGKSILYANLNTSGSADNTSSVIGSAATNLVTVTKLASGRPGNVTGASLAGGSNGTLAAGDYVAALDAAARYPGIDIVVVCEEAVNSAGQTTLNQEITRLAPLYPMVNFVTWDGKIGITQDSTQLAASAAKMATDISTKANNIVWCTNTSFTNDATAGQSVEGGTHLDMAAVLSQTAPDIHPGDEGNLPFLAGITELGDESIERTDFVALSAANVSTLQKTDSGFQFHTAVATDGSQVDDVRCAQYLIQSLTNYWKHDLYKPFSPDRMTNMIAKGDAFMRDLQHDGRIVDADSKDLGKAWKFQFVQTDEERAQKLGKLMCQIRLMPHLLYLVVMTEIGTGTSTFTLSQNP